MPAGRAQISFSRVSLCGGLALAAMASIAQADALRLDTRTSFSLPFSPAFRFVSPIVKTALPVWAGVDYFGGRVGMSAGNTHGFDPQSPYLPPSSTPTDAGQGADGDGGFSLAIIRWPGAYVPPILNLGEPGVLGTTGPGAPGDGFTGTTNPNDRFASPTTHANGDSGPDPNPTVVPVPLPAAAWSGLIALPAAFGAGWARRRRQRSA